jgi:glyoxylase-like metal-dependent hydrolase (beta-lactamase superfamily II)
MLFGRYRDVQNFVYMFHLHSFVFSPLAENTYVLHTDDKDCVIIDPGCYFSPERDQLREFLSVKGLKPKYLLNTHCHLDHVFGNQFIVEEYGLIPHIHPNEEEVLQNAVQAGLRWNLPFHNYTGPCSFLRAGDTVSLGNNVLNVIEAPGHSPGHICFYCAAQGFLIGGDVLFKNGIGRADLPGGDFYTLLTSIHQQLFILPDTTVVYPGHGDATTIGEEKRCNPYIKR